MIHCSSGAEIFRVNSPQVSLSVSKKSFCSHMYFLSGGSFKMVKNRKKRVNRGHSELIFEWTGPFLDLKICKEIRKSQGFSKKSSVFHLYFYVFYKKIITVEKCIFCIIIEWSRVFPENPAVSGTPTNHPLSLCQKSKKSLEQLLRSQPDYYYQQSGYMLNWSWELLTN